MLESRAYGPLVWATMSKFFQIHPSTVLNACKTGAHTSDAFTEGIRACTRGPLGKSLHICKPTSSGSGQCNIPAGLGPVKAVAAGYHHTAALQDGTLGEDGSPIAPKKRTSWEPPVGPQHWSLQALSSAVLLLWASALLAALLQLRPHRIATYSSV